MPARRDASLWHSLSGCIAAYQPVRGPDPLRVRYNIANGGTNTYRAEPGVLPTWGPLGWTFNGSSMYLTTGAIPSGDQTWSMLVRYANSQATVNNLIGCYRDSGGTAAFVVQNSFANDDKVGYYSGANTTVGIGAAPRLATGVLGIAGRYGYRNGVLDFTMPAVAGTNPPSIYIGCSSYNGSPSGYTSARIQAVAIYNRTLSPAEMWTVSRQMAYCDVNSDWSAWSPRRRYYIPAAQAAAGIIWPVVGNGIVGGSRIVRGGQ